MLLDTLFARMLRPMPTCPPLSPWVPPAVLLDFLGLPHDDPRMVRLLEWVPAEHFDTERGLSGLAACWCCMRLDPTRVMELFLMLRVCADEPERFVYPADLTQEARP